MTRYLNAATSLVERGVRTLKDYMLGNLEEGNMFFFIPWRKLCQQRERAVIRILVNQS